MVQVNHIEASGLLLTIAVLFIDTIVHPLNHNNA
jgi:hypothetical protein